MDIELIKRSIRLDRQRLQDTSSDLLIQKNIGKTAVIGRSRAIKERIDKKFMALEKELVTLTKKWFVDRDLEHGGRLDKQALKLSEEFGELCAGYLKQNENLASKEMCRHNLVRAVAYLKSISKVLGYDFADCFEVAYNEIKDRKGKWIDGTFVKEEDLSDEV